VPLFTKPIVQPEGQYFRQPEIALGYLGKRHEGCVFKGTGGEQKTGLMSSWLSPHIRREFLWRRPMSQQVQYVLNGQSRASYSRLPYHHLGIENNSIQKLFVVHFHDLHILQWPSI